MKVFIQSDVCKDTSSKKARTGNSLKFPSHDPESLEMAILGDKENKTKCLCQTMAVHRNKTFKVP